MRMSRRSSRSFRAPRWSRDAEPSAYFAMTADARDGGGGDGREVLEEAWDRCTRRLESAMLAWLAYACLCQEGPTRVDTLYKRLGVSKADGDLATEALEDMGMVRTDGATLRPLGLIVHH